MMITVLILSLVPQLPRGVNIYYQCIPNTKFVLNEKECFCDQQGSWDESLCLAASHLTCLAGEIIWQGCSQCLCQESGHLTCDNSECYDNTMYSTSLITTNPNTLQIHDSKIAWCTPFNSYNINCSICVCPASGNTSEAQCVPDNSCKHLTPSISDFLTSINKNVCIPRVMYLFPCLHCLCSEGGNFILENCIETCQSLVTKSERRCISKTFYKKNCNVCLCPGDSVPNDNLCTKAICNETSNFRSLESLTSIQTKCEPNKFVKPKCLYCICNTDGTIYENACLQLDCLNTNDVKYDVIKDICNPGEMVPMCLECFCLRNGMTNKTYCSNVCSYKIKLNVLENVLKDNTGENKLISNDEIERITDSESCDPNTLYSDQGRYCLCPENGSTNFKLCTSYTEDNYPIQSDTEILSTTEDINFNFSCTPNSFIEIECNICYCSTNGTFERRWCTNDDCNAKQFMQFGQKTIHMSKFSSINPNDTCVPGSISKMDCNFCICPESGILKERTCTKNKCSEVQDVKFDQFICEPLSYYLVDCNVCLCPHDGVKNVAKCSKNTCEQTLQTSDSCVPGQFFSNDCNVCVCPPNGYETDKVCTEYRCSDSEIHWKNIFKLSQNSLNNLLSYHQDHDSEKRNLDACFSGEEFEIGCKHCVCTDMGLKSYATCTDYMCDKNKQDNNLLLTLDSPETFDASTDDKSELIVVNQKTCFEFNLTDNSGSKSCTPGSIYVIRCKQCICTNIANITYFCRSLPKGQYCEQADHGFNYMPTGRRDNESMPNITDISATPPNEPRKHNHTKYSCKKPGKVIDACYICECDENLILIEEHCFKSSDENCNDSTPTFLDVVNKEVSR